MKGDAMKAALNLRVSGVLAGEGNPVKEGSTHDHVASCSSDIVKPEVIIWSDREAKGNEKAVLICSAYDFYPKQIKLTWVRDDKEVTADVTSTEELANGDWYYQVHSHLEYFPKPGEKISCVVEHASSHKPMIYHWDPSMPESERSKIILGAVGLLTGVFIAAGGLIYYKRKHTGFLKITLIGVCVVYINAQNYHEFGLIEACGDSDEEDTIVQFDDEHMGHVDFKEQNIIITLPNFIGQIQLPSIYEDAKKGVSICRTILEVAKEVYANSSEPLEPPWSSIYPRNDPQLNVMNTLICHVTGFFPPPVRVLWTKNNVNVTDESTTSRYYPNKDGTMNVFSRMSFIPEKGDIYSCSVEHKALQQPQTKIWDVEIREPDIGPAVFCGVGLALGLLGLGTGVFFIVKGN
ncbi:hypothetical protein Q8A67_010193 [Cirrhinus molitorella]|uniref:Ig-like domain-containing protein n=1 Tax=Cirrhinus molitorella TaxID=172907 RepID=A0AA88PPD2_9TELE|nr:hypothetical protein Q8A67_010193 [Cirrhinus molitorella]